MDNADMKHLDLVFVIFLLLRPDLDWGASS